MFGTLTTGDHARYVGMTSPRWTPPPPPPHQPHQPMSPEHYNYGPPAGYVYPPQIPSPRQQHPTNVPVSLPRQKRSAKPVLIGLGVAVVAVIALFSLAALLPSDSSNEAGGVGYSQLPESARNPGSVPTVSRAPVTSAAPAIPTGPAEAITARAWLLIAKNPDAHEGRRIVVYGEVTQFDSATGSSGFRANVDGVVHPIKYGYADYETNTVLGAGPGVSLADVVQDDIFKAEATVVGSYSYDTQIGGSTTVPMLLITKITVTGSTAG